MNLPITVTQSDLLEILLNIAPSRPVFIWGAPGIGKSALVEQFAAEVGLPCVSLLGSQLAPEDIIGIPQIKGDTSEFLPPKMIARKEPYVLFLDELNACSQEVQKAFYSLIHERRIGEYYLLEGSIVVGAGNRAQDSAIVKTMSSALINRMFHVQLKADARQWIKWAQSAGLHSWVIDYIIQRPDHLFSEPPKTEEPFSTPRSWHMLSDALTEYGAGEKEIPTNTLKMLAYGCLSPSHAGMFLAYTKSLKNNHILDEIIAQKAKWPAKPDDRDVLYFLAQSFRAKLLEELPQNKKDISGNMLSFVYRAKGMIKELSVINFEIAQMTVAADDEHALPDWFMVEVIRDLPRLVNK
ncbi:MAG: AAA family ATPase [Lachnospiraceae bacterium]|nr:AAA family ATPase [Lachnospiraceae bacterium]